MPEADSSRKQSGLATDPLCGRVLNGRFTIVAPLGAGGMGKVYRAIQQPLDRIVALKVLHPQFANSKDPGFVKRFVLEASMTSKLRHPNTVTVIDYGQTEDGIFYLAMEFLEGRTLADVLADTGPLTWSRAVGIGQQVCRSLREAHKFGIVHRDLKPANVMLLDEADSDVVKVLDFGLVKSFVNEGDAGPVDGKITQTGMLLGSPQYMAPEQAKNQGDPRSDIYSFGILMYEMMTGHAPFQGKDYLEVIVKHIKDPPPAFREIRPGLEVPANVEAVVMHCLQKEPAARFQSMDETLDALRALVGSQAGQSSSFGALVQTGKWGVPQNAPPPLPGARNLATPAPGQPNGLPMTPAPYGGGIDPTGAHTRNPSGQFQQLIQTAAPTPPPMQTQPLFASQTGKHPAVVEAPETPPQPEPQLFASEAKKRGGAIWVIAVLAVAALGGGGYWLMGREGKPPAPEKQPEAAAKPPEKPAAPPAEVAKKIVKFKVSSEPAHAQVFMGARDLGQTPTTFELPAGEDGTATAELVLILDGYHPLAVSAGGSGDVLIRQTLQRKLRGEAERFVRVGGGSSRGTSHSADEPEIVAAPSVPTDSSHTRVASASDTPARNESYAAFAGSFNEPAPKVEPPPATTPASTAAAGATSATPPAATTTPAAVGTKDSTGVEILPFGEGMTKPEVLEGAKAPNYTREAIAAGIEGLMVVKCVINTNGRPERCRPIKSLPYMEEAVLSWLQSRLYKPVTYQGRPVAVDYVFTVRLVAPKR